MKKLMSLMLGLTLLLGTTALFGDDTKPAAKKPASTKTRKSKKGGKQAPKKTDTAAPKSQ